MNNQGNLKLEERQQIHVLKRKGWKNKRIARHLNRTSKTIREEMKRCKDYVPAIWNDLNPYERAAHSHEKSKEKKGSSRKGSNKILKDPELMNHIITRLAVDEYSPEEISETISEELPGRSISFRSIYTFVKKQMPKLNLHLYHKGKVYRQRVAHRRGKFKEGAPEKTLITKRPKDVNERKEYGDWEVDAIVSCKGGKGAVLSLIERKSRQRVYFVLEDLKAKTVISRLLPFFRQLPPHMRKSITTDNGSEFCTREMLKLEKLGMKVYYCHAYKSQEKGSVERSNWQFRKRYPKGTDFSKVCKSEVKKFERKLNNRPMKLHGYVSSEKLYQEALASPPKE